MSIGYIGQRCLSEREPELGLGLVTAIERSQIKIEFPATQETRIYARDTSGLKRVQFTVGEKISTREGKDLTVSAVEEENGLLTYISEAGSRVREDEISDLTSVNYPGERLLAGQAGPSEEFDLRFRALEAQATFRQSEYRGYLGNRIDFIPHQLFILHEVSRRQIPRVLLADEVGLGKTIEACLILQRLLATGRITRALILVPESLVHQWFVELLRRFNLWFTIFDEERCSDLERSEPDTNPFLSSQLGLASISFLAGNEIRSAQALEAGWDLVVVDEAHHLIWTPNEASEDYQLVENLARQSPGLLLLTATPTQLGLQSHFARLRLLDPHRYDDYESFVEESAAFGDVAEIADKIIDSKPLTKADHLKLKKIFDRDPDNLNAHLEALTAQKPGSADSLLRTLLDQHGTGRVVFRNTRNAMSGFPKRQYCPAPIASDSKALIQHITKELICGEKKDESDIRYAFKDDPRLEWLVTFLKKTSPAKVLLICRSARKVLALEAALKDKLNINIALFHEDLKLVQRDRQAAWFADPDGAQLLLCSEIGSEGRNFQFAHHLVLFDLPLNPGLVEQRIGRLDRIGQTETIRIHVPFVENSADEAIAEWYHRGLDAFETPLHGGSEFSDRFQPTLLELAESLASNASTASARKKLEELIKKTITFRKELSLKMKKGRDRLLELNSFNPTVAHEVIDNLKKIDADPYFRNILTDLLDHFGVRIQEHEDGDVTLDATNAYVEDFPSIPRDGLLATYNRKRALSREDMGFLTFDHPLLQTAIDMLVNSATGTTAFCVRDAPQPNLMLEAVFVLEAVSDSRWHVDQFLAPTPVRVLVDIHGRDLSDEISHEDLLGSLQDSPLSPFLQRPEFNGNLLKNLVESASAKADIHSAAFMEKARKTATVTLTDDLQRLIDLSHLNNNVRPGEIEMAKEQIKQVRKAIKNARLRLDSLRLILEGASPQ